MDENISIWLVGNTGLRSPDRIQDGLQVFAQSPYVGNLHGREDTVNGFEHDLHRAENDGAENDVQIAEIGALHKFPSFQNTVAQV